MLIDFGIARWVSQQEKGVTAVGTMGYAPPELFSGRVQPASDVYSLGATMFHLLTGADPQDNPLLIFDFSKNPRPRQIAPSISSEMEQILMRTVEYKPEDRFRTAGELRNELATHLEKLMSGRVSYGMPAPHIGSETVQVQTVYCGFCGGRIAADDVFCAHCGARQPLGRRRLECRCCMLRDRRRNSSWPELPSSTRRSFCRKTATCSDARIRIQTSFRRSIFRGSIRKQKFRAAMRASGSKEKRFSSKISAR